MKDFLKWLQEDLGMDEDSMRDALGIMPGAAGASLYPSLYFAPMKAGAGSALLANHKKDAHFESGAEKKEKHKHKPKSKKSKKK